MNTIKSNWDLILFVAGAIALSLFWSMFPTLSQWLGGR